MVGDAVGGAEGEGEGEVGRGLDGVVNFGATVFGWDGGLAKVFGKFLVLTLVPVYSANDFVALFDDGVAADVVNKGDKGHDGDGYEQ